MKLLTKEIIEKLPKLYSQEEVEDPKIVCKFFHPSYRTKWYVLEGESQENGDYLFFGYVESQYSELGYFCLSELESIKRFGVGIERDMFFNNKKLSDVKGN